MRGGGVNVHLQRPKVTHGTKLEEAGTVVILLHGRDRSVDEMVELADRIHLPGVHYVAPQADGNSWYSGRFMDDITVNEPRLSDALECVDACLAEVVAAGIPKTRVVLLGFSQGGCIAAEYAVRNAQRYGAIVVYTGALIGPNDAVWAYPESFQGTPVFLGSSDVDGWIPEARVHHAANVFRDMGADVVTRIYKGMEHVVSDDEIAVARDLIARVGPTSA